MFEKTYPIFIFTMFEKKHSQEKMCHRWTGPSINEMMQELLKCFSSSWITLPHLIMAKNLHSRVSHKYSNNFQKWMWHPNESSQTYNFFMVFKHTYGKIFWKFDGHSLNYSFINGLMIKGIGGHKIGIRVPAVF